MNKPWWIAYPDGRKFNLDENELVNGVESGTIPPEIQGSFCGGPYVPITQSEAVQAAINRRRAREISASRMEFDRNFKRGLMVLGVFVILGGVLAVVRTLDNTHSNPASSTQSDPQSGSKEKTGKSKKEILETEEYKEGYKVGQELGAISGRKKYDYPTDLGFAMMANVRNREVGRGGEQGEWFYEGIRDGFDKEFKKKGGLIPSRDEFEELSWENAKPGVTLFSGVRPEATIVSLQKEEGLITVRYKNGSVEQKKLDAVGPLWLVKKKK